MTARSINLVLDQGVDFEATFTVRNEDSSALNLTGYTGEAKIRKHPAATKYNSFIVTFPSRVDGQIKVAMASTTTFCVSSLDCIDDSVGLLEVSVISSPG